MNEPVTFEEIWQNKPARSAILCMALIVVVGVLAEIFPFFWLWPVLIGILGIFLAFILLPRIKPEQEAVTYRDAHTER